MLIYFGILKILCSLASSLTIKTRITMTITEILDKVSSGKVFSAKFIKKDGSERVMNCRTGVVKHVNGKGLAFDPIKKGLIPVFDMKSDGYRFINYNTLISITIEKETYNIKE
tara:strand:- start:545 stop:883 length:339 start_codon:yes stop_codon:yes gene_type:complete